MKKTRQPVPEGLLELQCQRGTAWVPMSRDYDRPVMDARFEYWAQRGPTRLMDLHTGETLKTNQP